MENKDVAVLSESFRLSISDRVVKVRDTIHASMFQTDTVRTRRRDDLFFNVVKGKDGILKVQKERRILFQRLVIGSIPPAAFGKGGLIAFLRDPRECSQKIIKLRTGKTVTIGVQVPLRDQFSLDEVRHLLPSLVPRPVQDYVLISVGDDHGGMVFRVEGVVSQILKIVRK